MGWKTLKSLRDIRLSVRDSRRVYLRDRSRVIAIDAPPWMHTNPHGCIATSWMNANLMDRHQPHGWIPTSRMHKTTPMDTGVPISYSGPSVLTPFAVGFIRSCPGSRFTEMSFQVGGPVAYEGAQPDKRQALFTRPYQRSL